MAKEDYFIAVKDSLIELIHNKYGDNPPEEIEKAFNAWCLGEEATAHQWPAIVKLIKTV